jgi:hypothetical protein
MPEELPQKPIPLSERSVPEISRELQRVLGSRAVAYAMGLESPEAVGDFSAGAVAPGPDVEATLRDLAEVVETGLEIENGSAELVRATLIGMNPNLNDQAALELFHNGQGQRVVEAVRSVFDA